jgi:hypothetical protein
MRYARCLTSQPHSDPGGDSSASVEALSQGLLPSWSEEWLVLEQQRWDLLRLHALERLAEQFAADGRHVDALEAGLLAVAIEPYRGALTAPSSAHTWRRATAPARWRSTIVVNDC